MLYTVLMVVVGVYIVVVHLYWCGCSANRLAAIKYFVSPRLSSTHMLCHAVICHHSDEPSSVFPPLTLLETREVFIVIEIDPF